MFLKEFILDDGEGGDAWVFIVGCETGGGNVFDFVGENVDGTGECFDGGGIFE